MSYQGKQFKVDLLQGSPGTDILSVSKPLLYQAVAAPKMSPMALLSETSKTPVSHPDILRDNLTNSNMLKIDSQKDGVFNKYMENADKKNTAASQQEKENFTQSDESKNNENEDSAMITCGKMVVNHIIDKLYSSEISVAARKATGEDTCQEGRDLVLDQTFTKDCENFTDKTLPKSMGELSRKSDPTETDSKPISFEEQSKGDNYVTGSEDQLKGDNDESNNNDKSYDEADGPMVIIIKPTRKRQISQSSSKENESTENEDGDELQPLRKSRRRNKGQRYQMLINDGIIQPSKERMAALQKNSPQHER